MKKESAPQELNTACLHDVSSAEGSSNGAEQRRKPRREYTKHGDVTRKRLIRERHFHAIDTRTRAGKAESDWRDYALEQKGGKACPVHIREKINAGTFALWRSLVLRSWIIRDARKRGTPINRRRGKLPAINEQHDSAMAQWLRINDELELGKAAGFSAAAHDAERRKQAMRWQRGWCGRKATRGHLLGQLCRERMEFNREDRRSARDWPRRGSSEWRAFRQRQRDR